MVEKDVILVTISNVIVTVTYYDPVETNLCYTYV